jgi:steroid 5-alpha reductase family enzyme
LFWWGIFISCSKCLEDAYFIAIIGPLYVTILILTLSGIPLLERSANEKYRHMPEYMEYRQETSPLIPMSRYFYASLPQPIKRKFYLYYGQYQL